VPDGDGRIGEARRAGEEVGGVDVGPTAAGADRLRPVRDRRSSCSALKPPPALPWTIARRIHQVTQSRNRILFLARRSFIPSDDPAPEQRPHRTRTG
jgi:hypothetical protein